MQKDNAQQSNTNGTAPKQKVVGRQTTAELGIVVGSSRPVAVVQKKDDMADKKGAALASLAELAAIPDAASAELRRSKRMADTSGEVVLHQASKLKAGKDNEIQNTNGDTCNSSSFLHFPDEYIRSSFSSIGINLGSDDTSIRNSVLNLKKVEENSMHESRSIDWKEAILDKEEKNMAEEEEIDMFILNHLCGEIMDEVMDVSSDLNDFTVPLSKTKHHNSKGKKVKERKVSKKPNLFK